MDDREFSSPVCFLNYDDDAGPKPSALCGMCTALADQLQAAILEPPAPRELEWLVYETYDMLEKTVKEGCSLCRMLFQRMSSEEKELLKQYQTRITSYAQHGYLETHASTTFT
jgi:hypothetical protein